MTGRVDQAGEGATLTPAARRRFLSILLALGALLLATGGTLTAVELARGRGHSRAPAALLRGCPQAASSATESAPHSLGAWPYELADRGSFLDLRPAPGGRLIAIQTCGREEQGLRLVELGQIARPLYTSRAFRGVAPLASSALALDGKFFLGVGRLSISKEAPEAPYRLYCYLLDRRLGVVRVVPLGRGYGVSLLAGPDGSVLASTGLSLLRLEPDGSVRQVVSFVGEVLQHISLLPGSNAAIVSLFSPAAVPPTPSTTLALVDLRSGSVLSTAHLRAGAEVSSLAMSGRRALMVVGDGTSQHLAVATRLRPLSLASTGTSTTSLTALQLIGSGHLLALSGLSELSCLSPFGRLGRTTTPKGSSEVPSALVGTPRGTFALTPAGIGRLHLPTGCR